MKYSLDEYLQMYAEEHTRPWTRLTHMVGIPMIAASLPTLLVDRKWAAGLFLGGWMLQLLGHRIEGDRPLFLRDPFYIMAGPIWVAQEVGEIVGEALQDVVHEADGILREALREA